jgi:chromosomal replication initiator protein
MYFARKHTDLSLPELGRRFGRDHTTVLYAVRKVEEDTRRDAAYQVRVDAVEKAIGLRPKGR